jgi:hypothetical protein
VEGRVVDQSTGRPIPKVHLFATREGRKPAIRTTANEQGIFCFARLDPGSYSLFAQRTGYLDTVYQGSRFFGIYPMLRITSNARPSPVTIEMTPRCILAGRVVDADGDPVADAEVRADGADGGGNEWRNPGNITRTDENGAFRFYDLDPGTYRLIAIPALDPSLGAGYRDGPGGPLQEHEIETFYPNSPTAENSAPIVLKAGREISGIAITLRKAGLRHLTGRIVGVPGGKYLMAELRRASGYVEGRAIQVHEDGTFSQDGLTPGEYTLRIAGVERTVDLITRDVDGLVIEPRPSGK